MKKITALLFAVGAMTAAQAQGLPGSVSRLTGVFGLVSVSQDGVTRPGGVGTPLADGATVVVPSRGSATIETASGCTVPLRAGQAVTLNSRLSCSQLVSSISQGPIAPAAPIQTAALATDVGAASAAPAGAASVGQVLGVAVALGLGVAIADSIIESNRSNNASQISAE